MKSERRVLGNMAILGGGTFVAQFANFVFVLMIARAFGPELLGHYSLSMAISAIVVVFVSFGTIPMLARDIGRDSTQGGEILRALFPVQLALSGVAWTFLVALGVISGWSSAEVGILAAIATYQILIRMGEVLLSEPKGRQKMQIVALYRAGIPLLLVALAAPLLWLQGDSLLTISVMPVSAFIFFLIAWKAAVRLGGSIRMQWNWKRLVEALRRARPFFLIQLMSSSYERLGIVILGVLATRAVVGEFAAGERIVAAVGVFVSVLTVSALPALSHLAATDTARLMQLARRLVRLAWLIGLPVATGLFLFSEDIIAILFGSAYVGSAQVLKAASALIVLRALVAVLEPMSMATDRQRDLATGRVIALATLLVFAPILVPLLGAVGLAVSKVVAESVLVVVLIWRLAAAGRLPSVLQPGIRIGAACALAMAIGAIGAEWSLFARILAATFAGIVGLLLFRAVTKDDLQFLLELFGRKRALKARTGTKDR